MIAKRTAANIEMKMAGVAKAKDQLVINRFIFKTINIAIWNKKQWCLQ